MSWHFCFVFIFLLGSCSEQQFYCKVLWYHSGTVHCHLKDSLPTQGSTQAGVSAFAQLKCTPQPLSCFILCLLKDVVYLCMAKWAHFIFKDLCGNLVQLKLLNTINNSVALLPDAVTQTAGTIFNHKHQKASDKKLLGWPVKWESVQTTLLCHLLRWRDLKSNQNPTKEFFSTAGIRVLVKFRRFSGHQVLFIPNFHLFKMCDGWDSELKSISLKCGYLVEPLDSVCVRGFKELQALH